MITHYDIFETKLGWMGLLASPDGLRRSTLPQTEPESCALLLSQDLESAVFEPERFVDLRKRLFSYFNGNSIDFSEEVIDISDASPFLKAAWKACRRIPWGETRTYGWLAKRAGKPLAFRAAGQSMAKNRVPIIIPCHRVIASDGSLGGFDKSTSHLNLKTQLLLLETGSVPL